jgi:hypothetical protein
LTVSGSSFAESLASGEGSAWFTSSGLMFFTGAAELAEIAHAKSAVNRTAVTDRAHVLFEERATKSQTSARVTSFLIGGRCSLALTLPFFSDCRAWLSGASAMRA